MAIDLWCRQKEKALCVLWLCLSRVWEWWSGGRHLFAKIVLWRLWQDNACLIVLKEFRTLWGKNRVLVYGLQRHKGKRSGLNKTEGDMPPDLLEPTNPRSKNRRSHPWGWQTNWRMERRTQDSFKTSLRDKTWSCSETEWFVPHRGRMWGRKLNWLVLHSKVERHVRLYRACAWIN